MKIQERGDKGKSPEKKRQMKEGMRDGTIQEKGDKEKRSNAMEKGQKGGRGQGKDSDNIRDPEDEQSSVHKKTTEEVAEYWKRKNQLRYAAFAHLTPTTKANVKKMPIVFFSYDRKKTAKRSPCKNLLTSYISESGSEDSEEVQKNAWYAMRFSGKAKALHVWTLSSRHNTLPS